MKPFGSDFFEPLVAGDKHFCEPRGGQSYGPGPRSDAGGVWAEPTYSGVETGYLSGLGFWSDTDTHSVNTDTYYG